jgi:hypothetical protein
MEILSSGGLTNPTNREADVAIRVVCDRETLPLNLHGLVVTNQKVVEYFLHGMTFRHAQTGGWLFLKRNGKYGGGSQN